MSYAIENEFIQLAKELIDEAIPTPNAVWRQIANDTTPDPNKPWITTLGTNVEYPVRILFVTDTLQDRQILRHLDETTVPVGNTNAIMYKQGFVPTLKDIVLWRGRELPVIHVNEIAPVQDTIVYLMRLGL